MTLFEAFHHKKPSISHLQPFGRKCFIHMPEERHLPGSKLMPRAEEGIFLGYTNTPSIYKVHILARSHTFIMSVLNVKFESVTADSHLETEVTPTEATPTTSEVTPTTSEVTTATSISFARPITCSMTDSQQSLKPQQPLQQLQPSQTTAVIIPPSMPDSQRNQYIYLDDDHNEQVMISLDKYNDFEQYTHIDTEQEPMSYNQAVNGPYSDLWQEGIQQQLDALHSNNTWSVVPIPVGQNIVGSRWVFKLKHDTDSNINRHKARLVAQGYSQQPGFDYEELYSPVVHYDSLRLLIALSVYHHWRPQQLDIKAASVYGILNKDIYMQLPESSRVDGMCGKLNKCIYSLKQSPREWYHQLIDFLTPYRFIVSNFNPYVLMFKSNTNNDNDTNVFFIAVYVDDLSLFGPKGLVMDNLKDLLKSEFKVTDLVDLHWLLGIRIEYRDHDIALS